MKKVFKYTLFTLVTLGSNIAAKQGPPYEPTDDDLLAVMDRVQLGNRLVAYIRTNNLDAIGNILRSPHLQTDPTDFNTVRQGLLLHGARYNRPEVIWQGLLMNADINYRDRWGRTALSYAIAYSNKESIQLLLANKAACTLQEYLCIIKMKIPVSARLAASLLAAITVFELSKNTIRRPPDPDLPPRARL
ncbi:hypothetical protein FJ365_05480 [Candidatus Dependentiae bacterium]|nr:hypothetical protein [Candidatus Dependentiae bacterium]